YLSPAAPTMIRTFAWDVTYSRWACFRNKVLKRVLIVETISMDLYLSRRSPLNLLSWLSHLDFHLRARWVLVVQLMRTGSMPSSCSSGELRRRQRGISLRRA